MPSMSSIFRVALFSILAVAIPAIAAGQVLDTPAPRAQGSNSKFGRLNISPKLRTPATADRMDSTVLAPGQFQRVKVVYWHSDQIQHQRLLFEEPAAERFGVHPGETRQALRSAGKFFARGFTLPLTLATQRHREWQSSPASGLNPTRR